MIHCTHQNDSPARRAGFAQVLALALGLAAGPLHAEEQPSPAMLATVEALAKFMSALPAEHADPMFAVRGVCIVENFAPFLFCGPHAVERWEAGFRAHSAEEALTGIEAHFGAAHDFTAAGGRAYFSLPTTWIGLTHGRHFEEHGAWAFVLRQSAGTWRIEGYGWGVTDYTEAAP